MPEKYPPISPKCPHMLHGGDYNPDQWRATPEVWDEDVRLMKLAGCNAMSVGIFAWAALEPREGAFDFDWLDRVLDKLADNGVHAVLATPSGSKPAWMSQRYPEIRRVDAQGHRDPHHHRHNHCRTSPAYRDKCTIMNTKLAERYGEHPALLLWHVSNEYNGKPCHCQLCYAAFRQWLREQYADDLDQLNQAWWTGFWAHTYTDWDQIEPVDKSVHGLMLDWKRFTSDQTIDFFRHESKPLRTITPDVPITTNLMGFFESLNYFDLAEACDVISWDSYPNWCEGHDVDTAAATALAHDLNRSLGRGRPFMLMESAPSSPQWGQPRKRKRPGMHLLSSMQAVAHGSDTVQYFQWRKSRGAAEKFHGAVVDHVGHEHTRVFNDVAQLGHALAKLDEVVGATVRADVALVHDWENRWAIQEGATLGPYGNYLAELRAHHRPLWDRHVGIDVIDSVRDFTPYKLVVAPMLYMIRPGVGEAIRRYVEAGGTCVLTYRSGCVDRSDLCFLGGFPGAGLGEVFGIWDEELDILLPDERNAMVMTADNNLGLTGRYECRELCSIVHLKGAEAAATYESDFYAGSPAVTVNRFGEGRAIFLAARPEAAFLDAFYGSLADQLEVARAIDSPLPAGVSASTRTDGRNRYTFLMNFNTEPVTIDLDERTYRDLLNDQSCSRSLELPAYGVSVLVVE